MTAAEWLAERMAAAPEPLREHVLALASAQGGRSDAPEAIADAAVAALAGLLDQGDESRAIAADLLAIDALVTYACEAATQRWQRSADDAGALIAWCERFAARLSVIRSAQPAT